jgi:hypothetical protein
LGDQSLAALRMPQSAGQGADLPAPILKAHPGPERQHVQSLPPQKSDLLLLTVRACQYEVRPVEEDCFSSLVIQANSGGLVGQEGNGWIPREPAQGGNLMTIRQGEKQLIRTEIKGSDPRWF